MTGVCSESPTVAQTTTIDTLIVIPMLYRPRELYDWSLVRESTLVGGTLKLSPSRTERGLLGVSILWPLDLSQVNDLSSHRSTFRHVGTVSGASFTAGYCAKRLERAQIHGNDSVICGRDVWKIRVQIWSSRITMPTGTTPFSGLLTVLLLNLI